MSMVRLVVRDARRDIYADQHGAQAERFIGALGADPETIEELAVAMERFEAREKSGHFRGFRPGDADEPVDAGLVIIDLAARLIVCESTYCSATTSGIVSYHDGQVATEIDVRYHLAGDWLITSEVEHWRPLAEKRRRERLAVAPLDVRAVVYGKPLLKFIAAECLQTFRSRPDAPAKVDYGDPIYEQEYDLVRQIHVRWMMTPREDLRGQTPRQAMMSRHEHLEHDYCDRKHQWSFMESCPRGLDRDSAAYRFAGFGTHEMVVYYDMVRDLLWDCRLAVAQWARGTTASEATGEEFAAGEISRLARVRDEWLDAPYSDVTGRSGRSIIEKERARIPEAMTGHEAIIDPDCPLCQMQADMPGPTFWNLDGCNMDDDFAFSLHETYEQWEKEQREMEEFCRRCDAREAERKRLGVTYPEGGYAHEDTVWKQSFSASMAAKSPYMRLFAIGSHLCELTVDLKEPQETPAGRDLIDRLGRAFGNLRDVVQSPDIDRLDALIDPVLARFSEALEATAAVRPDLERKCFDLRDRLSHFLDPADEPEEPSPAPDNGDDDDMPF